MADYRVTRMMVGTSQGGGYRREGVGGWGGGWGGATDKGSLVHGQLSHWSAAVHACCKVIKNKAGTEA